MGDEVTTPTGSDSPDQQSAMMSLFDALKGMDGGEEAAEGDKAVDSSTEENAEKPGGAGVPAPTATPTPKEETPGGEKVGADVEAGEVPPEVADIFASMATDPDGAAKKFVDYLKSTNEKAVKDAIASGQESAQEREALAAAARKFYEDNSDLKGNEDIVGMLATKLEEANPHWDTEKLYSETADQARKRLNIVKKGPSLPAEDTSGGAQGAPVGKLTGQQLQDAQMASMFDAMK